MSKIQQKLQKKKERERAVRKKVLARREQLQAKEREENAHNRKLKRIDKLKRDMGKLNVWADELFMQMDENTLSQLEKNAKILKVLEEEFEQERENKRLLNKKLEEEGALTLDEKLSHMNSRLLKQARELCASVETEQAKETFHEALTSENSNMLTAELELKKSMAEINASLLENIEIPPEA